VVGLHHLQAPFPAPDRSRIGIGRRVQVRGAALPGLAARGLSACTVAPDAGGQGSHRHEAAAARRRYSKVLLEEGASIVDGLRPLRGALYHLFLSATESGDWKAATSISARIHESFQLSAKLTGELLPHATTNITNIVLSPDYQRLRSELLRALVRHPDAHRDVVAIFQRVGNEAATMIEHDAA
jgi:hypothetical protein